jgi:thioredoxin 1
MIEIIKFSRKDCRPCKVLANYLSEIDLESLNAKLTEIDIEDDESAVHDYGLQSVPTLVFKRSGVEVHRIVGLRPTEEIIDAIEHAKVAR